MAKRKTYSEKERALWILECQLAGSVNSVATRPGSPSESTLRSWMNRINGNGKMPQGASVPAEVYEQTKEELTDRLERLVYVLAGAMFEKLDDADLRATSVAFGVAFDKLALLRGDPTERVENVQIEYIRVNRDSDKRHPAPVSDRGARISA